MGNPALVNQLTAGGAWPHEDCGEACVASILYDAGKMDSVRDIERFDLAHGDNPADGTGGDVHVARLQAAGIPAHGMPGDTRANVRDGIAKGHNRWMVAIWSDTWGNPQPGSGIGHWILVYGYDAATDTFHTMNPLGGRLASYNGALIEAAQQSYGIAVDVPIGAPTAQPVSNLGIVTAPITLVGDFDMATVQKLAFTIATDPNGNGWDAGFEQRNIAWNRCLGGPYLNGTDPDQAADKDYPHGTSPCAGHARPQQRDGKLLVEIMGCRPNSQELVFQDVLAG